LADVPADSPMILIGRSPACDMVLRVKGLNPVHFLLEWAGEGEFDPMKGVWALTEVRRTGPFKEQELAISGSNRGVVLGKKPVEFGGLTWKWTEDRLAPAELKKDTLRDQVLASAKAVSRDLLGATCVELVRLSPDGQTVVDVEHLVRRDHHESKILQEDRKLRLRWRSGGPSLEWYGMEASSLRGVALEGASKYLDASDILYFKGNDRSYFVRMVPRLRVKESPREIWQDPFIRFAGICFAAAIPILGLIHTLPLPTAEDVAEKTPRMARIEIKEAPPPPPPEPPAPVIPEPKVEPAPAPPAPEKSSEGGKKRAKTDVKKKQAPRPKQSPKPEPVVADVGSVGLLGSMKKHEDTAVVSADSMVTQNSLPDSATGSAGKVLVQAPSDIVDLKKAQHKQTGGDVLADSTNDVSAGADFSAEAVTAGGTRFAGGAFSIDASDSGDDGDAAETGFAGTVRGGLSREAVGRAVFNQRAKIRACYQTALLSHPKLAGRLVLKWQISPEGVVTSIKPVLSDLHLPSLESCVMSVLRATPFPSNPRGLPTMVLYPFVFRKS
jgi:hypothetical protein